MQAVTIYSTRVCPYCMRAKALLGAKQVAYTEILVDVDPAKRVEMEQKSGGRRSVPQIFIGECHVGGFDELYALERKGELDPLLNN
ncbi:MAG TPA: glutaredoxin 3 [Gammaproteobacteria bacterium]|nr:glutaredoxin 3 [Gammaproteobacteria bacterium]